MKHNRNIVFALLPAVWVMFVLVFATGCTEARETMIEMRRELRQEIALEDTEEQQGNKQLQVPSVSEILEDDITIEETYEPVQAMGTPVAEITVALYFADAAGETLVKTEKQIPKVEGMARATIETLLEGPAVGSNLASAVPAGTQLLDINVKADEKKCIVDFSHELRGKNAADTPPATTLEAIARTLCQFDSIETVEFRIEGQRVATWRHEK